MGMNLSEWAERVGVSNVTAYRWSREGTLPKLARLLADGTATTVVVEHRDRLARFGIERLEAALSAQGRRVVVAEPGEVDDDWVGDVTEVLRLFCARLYGARGASNRAEKALGCARHDIGPAALR